MAAYRRPIPPLVLLAALAACAPAAREGQAPSAPVDIVATAAASPSREAAADVAPTLGAEPGAVATLSADLAATVAASLPAVPTAPPDGEAALDLGPSFDGASVMALPSAPDEPERYVSHTTGMRGFDPRVDHQVAIWERDGATWNQLAGATLSDIDYLPDDDPAVASPAPGLTWLGLSGGVGAHGGCFALLAWDGTALSEVLSHCGESPGAGELVDLDGDGGPEVLLDATDHYVFCYACGVRYFGYQAKAWDGKGLVDVTLAAPAGAPAGLEAAARLAKAGLWRQAAAALDDEAAPPVGDAARTAGLIRRHADAYAAQAADGPYPLLDRAFYGDYDGALEPFRGVAMADALRADGPLVAGTVAEGWTEPLADWLERVTANALAEQPDLAAAWFLRGWAAQLADPASATARAHVARAAELDADEPLYAAALAAMGG